MADNGYVYILMNPSMKNLVKIGKTQREPDERAQELSSTTGVPTPFIVVYDCYFESCSEAEVFVHTYLENKGLRVSSNREFFEIPIKDAIDSVMKAKEHFGEFDKNKTLDNSDIYTYGEPWDELLEKAKSFRYGIEDIQDDNDAIEYYLKAIKLGYVEGYQDIADIYYDAGNSKKSFEYYKKAVNNGVYQCYTDIASYYLYEEKDFNKALQSYEFYMKHTDKDDLDYFSIVQYFKLAIYAIEVTETKTDIEYFEKTIKYKNEILEYLKTNLSEAILELNEEYASFYKLPISLQNEISNAYKKANSNVYLSSSFIIIFNLTYGFIEYLEEVYKKGYSTPSSSEIEICSIHIETI